ncbi:MAG: LysE family translocator [Flavobacteriaceae bacterium]|nr:LysE family translocator [Flavobacteriaceae bacterium]
MNDSIFLLFCSTVIIITLSPGPDIIFVISQSLQKGYEYGIKVSLGLITGLFLYTIASILGLSWVLNQFPQISSSIKIFGAIYIGYLAYLEFPKKEKRKIKKSTDYNKDPYTIGLIMNLSNPKIILFFISLFPQFVFHNDWSIKYQFFVLGATFIIIALLIFSLVSILSSLFRKKILSKFNSKYFSYLSSFILASISILLFFSEIKYLFK